MNLYLETLLLSFRSQVIEGVNPIWVVQTRGAIKLLKYDAWDPKAKPSKTTTCFDSLERNIRPEKTNFVLLKCLKEFDNFYI